MKNNIIIVGAGASGLMCSAYLAYRLKSMGITCIPQITLLERSDRPGRKILATGNGRCNLTNNDLSIDNYYSDDSEKLESILSRFNNQYTIDFFTNVLGVTTTNLNEWIYPATLRSSTILDSLRMFLEENGIRIITSSKVTSITHGANYIVSTDDSVYEADYVISAVGGASYPSLGTDGSSYLLGGITPSVLVNPTPALVPLKSSDEDIKKLAGIRLPVKLTVNSGEITESGEILFTDYGISGICVMQISGYCNSFVSANGKYPKVTIDLLPAYDSNKLNELIRDYSIKFPNRSIDDCLSGFVRNEITRMVVNRIKIGCKIAGELKSSDISKLTKAFKSFDIRINGSEGFDHSQVTRGGVKLGSLSEKLQADNGVYYIGEIVNVDGKCGGYNLQWAWSSAMLVADEICSKYE